jgi:ankyrin repeat protein
LGDRLHKKTKLIKTLAINSLVGLMLASIGVGVFSFGRNVFLVTAALHGNNRLVTALIKLGADPNTQSGEQTPLTMAIPDGHLDTVKLLIEHGANVNQKGADATAPLLFAAPSHPDIVRLLLQHGANVNVKDEEGDTALIIAACNANAEMTKILLDYQADPNLKNNKGETALITLALIDYDVSTERLVKCSRLLVQAGADVNVRDANGVSPIEAAKNNHHSVLIPILK